jgi:hypothetical protein
MLLAVVWFFVSRDLKEIRDDVKELRETVPVLRVEMENLRANVQKSEDRIWHLERIIAIKPEDIYDVPRKKKKENG